MRSSQSGQKVQVPVLSFWLPCRLGSTVSDSVSTGPVEWDNIGSVPGMGRETHQDVTSLYFIFNSSPVTSATTKDAFTRKVFQEKKI